jgi:hypothetical protein
LDFKVSSISRPNYGGQNDSFADGRFDGLDSGQHGQRIGWRSPHRRPIWGLASMAPGWRRAEPQSDGWLSVMNNEILFRCVDFVGPIFFRFGGFYCRRTRPNEPFVRGLTLQFGGCGGSGR